MNKRELINTISEKNGLEKGVVEKVLDAFEKVVLESLKSDQEVVLTGFGTFSARQRAGRIGVNPRNPAEKIQIPAVRVAKFKVSKILKDALKK